MDQNVCKLVSRNIVGRFAQIVSVAEALVVVLVSFIQVTYLKSLFKEKPQMRA
jgi:hypothetical protein